METLAEFLAVERIVEAVDVEQLSTMAVAFVPRLFTGLLLLFVFWLGYKLTGGSLRKILLRGRLEPALVTLLVDRLFKFVLLSIGTIMAADQLGVNIGAALAGLGVAGIAIGFAAQDLLSNVIAGFVIFWDKPFRVGDFIRVADQYGQVREITLRSTRIRTNQNAFVVIPNRNIVDDVVVNQSTNGALRLDVPIGIAYKEDIAAARDALVAAAGAVDGLADDPPPAVVVIGLGDSSVDLQVRVWIPDASKEALMTVRVLEASKLALDRAGIEIPFPHMQLFLDDVTDRAAKQLALRG